MLFLDGDVGGYLRVSCGTSSGLLVGRYEYVCLVLWSCMSSSSVVISQKQF